MEKPKNEDPSNSAKRTVHKYVRLLSYVAAVFVMSNVTLFLLFALVGEPWSELHPILVALSIGWSFTLGCWCGLETPFAEEDADPVRRTASHMLKLLRVAPEPRSKLREKVQWLLRHGTLDKKQMEAVLQIVATERPDLSEDIAVVRNDLLVSE